MWVKSSFESTGLGFFFKHASAKARDGVRERNFGFLRKELWISAKRSFSETARSCLAVVHAFEHAQSLGPALSAQLI